MALSRILLCSAFVQALLRAHRVTRSRRPLEALRWAKAKAKALAGRHSAKAKPCKALRPLGGSRPSEMVGKETCLSLAATAATEQSKGALVPQARFHSETRVKQVALATPAMVLSRFNLASQAMAVIALNLPDGRELQVHRKTSSHTAATDRHMGKLGRQARFRTTTADMDSSRAETVLLKASLPMAPSPRRAVGSREEACRALVAAVLQVPACGRTNLLLRLATADYRQIPFLSKRKDQTRTESSSNVLRRTPMERLSAAIFSGQTNPRGHQEQRAALRVRRQQLMGLHAFASNHPCRSQSRKKAQIQAGYSSVALPGPVSFSNGPTRSPRLLAHHAAATLQVSPGR